AYVTIISRGGGSVVRARHTIVHARTSQSGPIFTVPFRDVVGAVPAGNCELTTGIEIAPDYSQDYHIIESASDAALQRTPGCPIPSCDIVDGQPAGMDKLSTHIQVSPHHCQSKDISKGIDTTSE